MKTLLFLFLTLSLFASLSHSLSCPQSQILNKNGTCIQPEYIEGCLIYQSVYQCEKCAQGYEKKGVRCDAVQYSSNLQAEGVDLRGYNKGCLQYEQNDDKNTKVCKNCASRFRNINGTCKKGIKNCLKYSQQTNNQNQPECIECIPHHSLILSQCKLNNELGCEQFSASSLKCSKCYPPFALTASQTQNEQNHCSIPFCQSVNQYGCTSCQCGYHLTPSHTCVPLQNGCILTVHNECVACLDPYRLKGSVCEIEGCLKYEGNVCGQCAEGYEKIGNGGCGLKGCQDWLNGVCFVCLKGFEYVKGKCVQVCTN